MSESLEHILPNPERLLSGREAANFLGISGSLLRALVRTGALPVVRLGRRRLYRPADLNALIEQRLHQELERQP